MSLVASNTRLIYERLGHAPCAGSVLRRFRIGRWEHVGVATQDSTNRRSFGASSSNNAVGPGTCASSGAKARSDCDAMKSFSSLRQDAKHSLTPPHYAWILPSAACKEFRMPDGPGAETDPDHDLLESTEKSQFTPRNGNIGLSRAMSLDGRDCGAQWLAELVPTVARVSKALGRRPGLCVIHVGDRKDSKIYVSKKEDACKEMHISSTLKHLPASATQEDLHAAIDEACADDAVDGVLVQLPLPPHLNEYDVMERLDPRKDVDGFHPLNMGRMLARNAPPRFVPATALGCMQLLKAYNISVTKKHVVVVGDSNIVGTPLSVLLRDAGAGTVTVCHRIAYNNIFEDRMGSGKLRQLRPHAHACLPRLPGPYSSAGAGCAATLPTAGDEPSLPATEARADSRRRSCEPPDAARVTVVQKSDATEIVIEAANRPGLLNSLTSVFCNLELNVRQADVQTHQDGRRIHDVFEVTDMHGLPLRDGRKLRRLSALLRERVGGVVIAEPGTWDDGHLAALTRTADVLVVAVGYPELVKGDWIKPGAVVLDVGINVVPSETVHPVQLMHKTSNTLDSPEGRHDAQLPMDRKEEIGKASEGRIVGDVSFREVVRLASAVTPVPGGVGPMTIAALIHNVVLAAQYRAGLKQW